MFVLAENYGVSGRKFVVEAMKVVVAYGVIFSEAILSSADVLFEFCVVLQLRVAFMVKICVRSGFVFSV